MRLDKEGKRRKGNVGVGVENRKSHIKKVMVIIMSNKPD